MPFTVEQPTDWAIHIHDGIWQKSKKEMELIKDKKARCEVQCMKLKFDQPATSLAWSLLRPYVYISDGGRVRIYRYNQKFSNKKISNQAILPAILYFSNNLLPLNNNQRHLLPANFAVNGK